MAVPWTHLGKHLASAAHISTFNVDIGKEIKPEHKGSDIFAA